MLSQNPGAFEDALSRTGYCLLAERGAKLTIRAVAGHRDARAKMAEGSKPELMIWLSEQPSMPPRVIDDPHAQARQLCAEFLQSALSAVRNQQK
jgi:hypothetical protein